MVFLCPELDSISENTYCEPADCLHFLEHASLFLPLNFSFLHCANLFLCRLMRNVTGFCLLGSIILTVFSLSANAVEMKNLTEVDVIVANESDAERYRASYLGLAEVLVRLSGRKDILENDALRPLLEKSSQYLVQFSYENIGYDPSLPIFHDYPLKRKQKKEQQANTNSIPIGIREQQAEQTTKAAKPVGIEKAKLLRLKFDQSLLLKTLQSAALPVWDVNRPEVMMWWAVDSGEQRAILSESDESKARIGLSHYAEQRGLAIKFPLMDLQDQKAVNVTDVWGAYADEFETANARYGVTTWVLGKNYYEQGLWKARWTVSILDKRRTFNSQSKQLFALQKAVMGNIAEQLSAEYAVLAGENNSVFTMKVLDIDTLDDFDALIHYLEALFVVDKLELQAIKGSQVDVKLTLKEDFEKFKKLLALDKKMAPVEFQETQVSIENTTDEVLTKIALDAKQSSTILLENPVVQTASKESDDEPALTSIEQNPQAGRETPLIFYQWLPE